MREARLAEFARDGDREAFADIVDAYKDKIYQLGYRMLGNAHEAEDIVQETFLKVFANLEKYDPSHKFSTWIYRIGTNLCIDRLRKRKSVYSLDAEVAGGEGSDGYSMLAGKDDTPEDQAMLSETRVQIRNAIEELPEKYRSVVVLRYFHDLSLQEISHILGMPVTTIKTRVHRGREYLRRKLQDGKFL